MSDNPLDEIFAEAKNQAHEMMGFMKQTYKKTKPFNQPEVTPEMQVYWFDTMSPEQHMALMEKHGVQHYMAYASEIKQMKARRTRQ